MNALFKVAGELQSLKNGIANVWWLVDTKSKTKGNFIGNVQS